MIHLNHLNTENVRKVLASSDQFGSVVLGDGVSKGSRWTEAASHSQAAKCTNSTQKGNQLHYCWQSTTSLDGHERRAVFIWNHA